jgi:hypothetical protein
MDEDTDRILNGEDTTNESENKVEDVPQAFKDHIEKYSGTIKAVDNARLPYYVQDNRARVNEVLGIDSGTSTTKPKGVISRQLKRTKDFIDDVKRRWNLRKDELQYTEEQRANFREIEKSFGIKRRSIYVV